MGDDDVIPSGTNIRNGGSDGGNQTPTSQESTSSKKRKISLNSPKRLPETPMTKSMSYLKNEMKKFIGNVTEVKSYKEEPKKVKTLKRITMMIDLANNSLKETW